MYVDYVRVYQGDWTELSGEEAYVASAEGVALISDDYLDETGTVPALGLANYQGVVNGSHAYDTVDYTWSSRQAR